MLDDIEDLAHGYLHPESTEYLLKQGSRLNPVYRRKYIKDLMERCPIRYWISLSRSEMYDLMYMGDSKRTMVIKNVKWLIKNYAEQDYDRMLSAILKTKEMCHLCYFFEHLSKRERRKAIVTFLHSDRFDNMICGNRHLDKLIEGLEDPRITRMKKSIESKNWGK